MKNLISSAWAGESGSKSAGSGGETGENGRGVYWPLRAGRNGARIICASGLGFLSRSIRWKVHLGIIEVTDWMLPENVTMLIEPFIALRGNT